MTERIDFALEPGVILFAVLFFVLVNVLLAAVLYPYFRSGSSAGEASEEGGVEELGELIEEGSADPEALDDRVDQFLEDIHREREHTG